MISKWRKKPSKEELLDVIDIQREEISRLNKERMKFNVVIRNEEPIRIDTHGLDYMVDLEQKYDVLQNIIKEAIEYIKENAMFDGKICCDDLYTSDCDKLIKILEGE